MEAVEEARRRWPDARRGLWEILQTLAVAAVLAALTRALLFQTFYIPSGSMRPTLEPGDYILVNRLVYRLQSPRRGDIIVFRYPRDERWDFVKRVAGLPGDVIEERDGRFWVNGTAVAEPYSVRAGAGLAPSINLLAASRVPPGQLFVLGDNRGASLDSRFWGTVAADAVIGKAFLIYWSRGMHWWDIRWGRLGTWLP